MLKETIFWKNNLQSHNKNAILSDSQGFKSSYKYLISIYKNNFF